MKLRSIELALPDPAGAAAWMVDVWGLFPADVRGTTHYLRGTGAMPYLVAFEQSGDEFVRSTTFTCSEAELAAISRKAADKRWPARAVTSADPGDGAGLLVELPEGTILRFLAGTSEVAPREGFTKASKRVAPVKLTHVVFNSADAELLGHAVEDVLNFRVSDRTKGMVFVRCNDSHHSTAFARAGFASLNHVAFEMDDLDAVMRGIGWMNGQLVQDQPISDMIWDVAFIIEYCSTFTPLSAGDVIVTGTPGGVGDKRNPPLYMKAGDTCEVSIGSIGTLSNPVVDEA